MNRRTIAIVVATAGIVGVSLLAAAGHPEWSLAGDSAARLTAELLAGVAVVLAGVVVIMRGPDVGSGALLCAAGMTWLIAEWENPAGPGAAVFTAGMILAATAPALVAHALLVHGRGRLETLAERVAIMGAYAGLAGLAGVAAALVSDPRAAGCSACPSNLVAVLDAPEVARSLERGGQGLGAAALAAAALLAARRLWRATAATRRTIAPVLVPGTAFLALVVADHVHVLARGWEGIDRLDAPLLVAQSIALIFVALGVLRQRAAAARIRGRLARLVVDMARTARPEGLRELMAAVLEDPTLDLVYAFDDGWIDATGSSRPQPARESSAMTTLLQDGEVLAVLEHRPGLFDDPRLVDELGRAARLAVDHERLQAQQRAHLRRLRAARAEIVAAADGERRRLERDLHDGAQQSLAALAMAIGLARGSVGSEASDELAAAQAAVRAALDGVRAMAHATYPAALDEAGLAAALDVLSEWRPHVELGMLPEGRFDPAVEAGAYFIVSALTANTAPAPAPALVDFEVDGGELALCVRTTSTRTLTEVEDRVGALGGMLSIEDTAAGSSVVRVRLTCA